MERRESIRGLDDAVALLEAQGMREAYRAYVEKATMATHVLGPEGDAIVTRFTARLFDGMARAYAQEFSVQQLKDLRRYYESDLGQAELAKRDIIAGKCAELVRSFFPISSGDGPIVIKSG